MSSPVGFVKGTTVTSGGAVSALVETASLPFVGLTKEAGGYVVAALAGSGAQVRATVPGTSLHFVSFSVPANM